MLHSKFNATKLIRNSAICRHYRCGSVIRFVHALRSIGLADELHAAYEDDLGLQDVHFSTWNRVYLGGLDLRKLPLAQISQVSGGPEDQNLAEAKGAEEVQDRARANARTAIELGRSRGRIVNVCTKMYFVYCYFRTNDVVSVHLPSILRMRL